MKRFSMRAFVFVFACLAGLAMCRADELAAVTGLVTDQNGRSVPGVTVLITNLSTNVVSRTVTNDQGIYRVPALQPGIYRMTLDKDGFKSIVKSGVELHVQDVASINFELQIGSVNETVTVEAGGLVINTTNASVSTVIDRNFVESLPLNGRSFNTLLQLTQGVVIAPATAVSGQFSVSGQRTTANTFSVDGVSANFGSSDNLEGSGTGAGQAFSVLGGTSSLVSVEALQEFRVETSSFAPEFGHTPGGQVILTTRSGTSRFHGGAYEYFRNDVMDGNDWFADQKGIARAAERHNDFGGYLGGPILRDRIFFFFSYEGARLRLPQTSVTEVPSEYARTYATTNKPTLAPYVNAFPQPNDRTITPGVYASQFAGSFSNAATLDATSIRIDDRITDRLSIFGRYNYTPSQTLGRPTGGTAASAVLSHLSSTDVNTQTLTLGSDMLLSNRISNSVRGNYSTQSFSLASQLDSFGGATPASSNLFLGSLPGGRNLAAFLTFDTGLYTLGPTVTNKTMQAEVVDDLVISSGTHQVKLGEDYRAIFLHREPDDHEVVVISPNVQSFLTTGPIFLDGITQTSARVRTQSFSLYGQDTWKPTRRLAVTYGLRWELDPAPSPRGTTTLAAWTNTNNPSELTLAPAGTPLWSTTYANFAPRIGVAYQLVENGNFVLRAGWGLFYDLGANSAGGVAQDFPQSATKFSINPALPVNDPSPYLPVISLAPPFPAGVRGYSPNLSLPRSYQWNVALEKSFGGQQVISATYVGQAGRDLLRLEALFQPNSNFSGDFGLTLNDARSNYNALQLQYRRPLSKGLQALLNYTYSHSLDNASDDRVAGLSNTVISAASDHASSDFDVRHSFSGAITYAIPGVSRHRALSLLTKDWSIDTVIVSRTGFPFNAQLLFVSPDPSGFASSRPDLVPGQPLWISAANAPGGKMLNSAAFRSPSTIRQGTEGRNDIPGFGLTQVDLSIGRKFSFTERLNLQFRADAFNVFNHPNFTNPDGQIEFGPLHLQATSMLNRGLGGLNALFQEGGPRSLQLSLKLAF